MNIAQLRQKFQFLREFTDEEVASALIAAHGITDTRDPRYSALEKQFLGYDRTAGEKVKDVGVGLVQGIVGLGETAGMVGGAMIPGVKAFDNPVVNAARALNRGFDDYKSPGLRAQEQGAQVAGDIAVQRAADEGAGTAGRIFAGAKAQGSAYFSNPGLAVQDAVQSVPSLAAGGLVGRGVQVGARSLGASQVVAARAGIGGAVGASAGLQGGDVAGDTYERMRAAGADYDTASREAVSAGAKAGAVSAGLTMLPGAATIERSMIRGVGGRGGVVGAVRGGAAEFASEAVEEGYGRYAGNQAVRTVDPTVDPASGVGQAAVQGGFAAAPLGAVGGLKRSAPVASTGQQPRTETGEIDLTGSAPSQTDVPAYQRRGLDPLNERSSPWMPPSEIQNRTRQQGLAVQAGTDGQGAVPAYLQNDQNIPPYLRKEPTAADIAGPQVNPMQRTPANMADFYSEQTPDPYDTSRFTRDPTTSPGAVPQGATAVPAPQVNANFQSEPGAKPQYDNGIDFTRDVDTSNLSLAEPGKATAPAKPTVGRVLMALEKANAALGKSVIRKDGQVSQSSATAPVRAVLEAKDPLGAMRELYQDGKAPRDELLDVWHKELTGQTVAEAKAVAQDATTGVDATTPEVQYVPAKGPTLAERKISARADGAGAAMDGMSRGSNPHKPGSASWKEWNEGHDEFALRAKEEKGRPLVKKLVEVVENTKDETEYDESLYALYKLAAEGDVTAFNYFHRGGYYDRSPKPAQLAELNKLRGRWDTEKGQERGRKFGVTKAARLTNPDVERSADIGEVDGDAEKVVRRLATQAKNQQDREVAARIAPYLKGVRVVVVDGTIDVPQEVEAYFSRDTDVARGLTAYDRDSGETAVFLAPGVGTKEDVALHELIHAATIRVIDDPRAAPLRSELEKTRQAVLRALAREKVDGTIKANPARRELGQFFSTVVSDGHELLAYAFSSPSLRDFLRDLDANGNKLPRTVAEVRQVMPNLWQRVVNAVLRTFGLSPAFKPYLETVVEGGQIYTRPGQLTMFQQLDELLAKTLTGPTGGPGGTKFSVRGDVLSKFGQRFGASMDPKKAVQDTQAALQALRQQATDYRSMAQRAMTTGRTETATGLLERARNFEQQVEQLTSDLSVAKAAEALSGTGDVFKANAQSVNVKPLAEGARALTATLKAQLKGEEINKSLLNMLTLRQIDEQYGHKLPALRDWVNVVMERSSTASKLAAEADRVALQWQQDVPRAEMKPLAEILLRASNAELQLDNTKAEYVSSLSAKEKAEYDELRAKLEALSPAAKQARKDALDILKRQWQHTHEALKKFITLTVSDPGLRQKRLDDLKQEFGRNHGDYFPLSRFGDRVVIARGAAKDGRDVVTFHESAKGVEDEVRRLKTAGVNPDRIIVTLATEYDPRKVPGSGFIRDLHAMIDSVADGEEAHQLHMTLQQLYLKSLPEMSGAKHMIRRENVEGYSHDALRTFADAVTRGSRYASHLEFGPAAHAAMEAAEAQSRSSDKRTAAVVIGRKDGQQPLVKVVGTGTERLAAVEKMAEDGYAVEFFNAHPETVVERLAGALEGASPKELAEWAVQVRNAVKKASEGVEDLRAAKELYNYMVRAQKADFNPEPGKLTELAGQLGYAWYLGFSPAFWAMNTLQNPMVGIPHLGAKYGVARASAEWMRAASWFAKVRVGKRLGGSTEPFSVEWLREQVKAGELKGINKEELDMLQRLEDRQVLDFTQAMDLSRIGAASNSTWYKAMRLAAAGAHHTEVFNRVSFALAAYRLAMKSRSDMTHEEATRAAERDVASAHFDYSYTNKPLWMGKSTPALRLVFMFQQYRQHMLYWWANTIKDATKGLTKEDRSRARKAALLMGTTQLLFAGTMGLPFIGAVATLANLLGGGDDGEEPFDFERWMREAAVGMTGSEAGADVVLKGVFAALGADISKRIGQGDLLPLLNPGSARFERDFDDKTRAYLFDMLGPLGSIALGAARATEAFSSGDYMRGLAAAMPKAVADIVKAYQQSSEGLKDKRGQHLATEEAFDGWDAAVQAAGITPTAVSNAKQARGAVLDIQNHFRDQSRRLTGAFIEAWMRNDSQGVTEALADIQRYNGNIARGRTPARELLITPDRLRAAIVERQRRAMLLALTGGLADTRQQLLIATRVSGLYDLEGRDIRLDSVGLPKLPGAD